MPDETAWQRISKPGGVWYDARMRWPGFGSRGWRACMISSWIKRICGLPGDVGSKCSLANRGREPRRIHKPDGDPLALSAAPRRVQNGLFIIFHGRRQDRQSRPNQNMDFGVVAKYAG